MGNWEVEGLKTQQHETVTERKSCFLLEVEKKCISPPNEENLLGRRKSQFPDTNQ